MLAWRISWRLACETQRPRTDRACRERRSVEKRITYPSRDAPGGAIMSRLAGRGNCSRRCMPRPNDERSPAAWRITFEWINNAFGEHVGSSSIRFRRKSRPAVVLATIAGLIGAVAAMTPLALAPGVSFRISSSTQVYAGATPRGQDDEVMRGR